MKMTKTMWKIGAIAALLIGALACAQFGPATGLCLLGLMAVPLIPPAQSLRLGNNGFDKAAFLRDMKARVNVLQPSTAARVQGVLVQLEESLKPENAKKGEERMADLITRARNSDVTAQAELAKMRIVTVENFIIASTNPLAFFDTVTLADNEVPIIENTTKQQIVVSYLGQDGQARKTQPIRQQAWGQVDLHEISTEEYEYQLRDIYKGEIKTASLANVDLSRDLGLQISALMWPFIKAAIGPFVTTGPEPLRTFVPHSIINIKNLPTTNLLEPDDNTPTTQFRKACLDLILKYAASWGNNTLGQGIMYPTAVYIPSSEVMGFLDSVEITTPSNSKVEEIFDNGFVLSYGGARWTFIGDATLDPDEGLAYVKFNRPIGLYFTKPGMDQTFEDDSIGMRKQNKGSVSMLKVVGWGMPINWFVNVAAVKYHDTIEGS